jgi:hypothetical protein
MGGKPRTLQLNEMVRRALAVWMYERERIIKEALSKYPSIQVPDLLLIHDNHGKLTG